MDCVPVDCGAAGGGDDWRVGTSVKTAASTTNPAINNQNHFMNVPWATGGGAGAHQPIGLRLFATLVR